MNVEHVNCGSCAVPAGCANTCARAREPDTRTLPLDLSGASSGMEQLAADLATVDYRPARPGMLEVLLPCSPVQLPMGPIPMLLHCPECALQHVDAPEAHASTCSWGDLPGQPCDCKRWTNPPHRSHLCHGCGHVWRPADVPTTGVAALATKGDKDSVPGLAWPEKLRLAEAERDRLRALIDTPHVADFMRAVDYEAAHQQLRWGSSHDAGKAASDWFWLLGYLAGKAVAAFAAGNRAKGLHHIISSGAVLLNWHRHVTGQQVAQMRPGIEPPTGGES